MDNISLEIQNISDLTSLILVFVTVLFGISYPQVQDDISEEIPPRSKAQKRHRTHLLRSLFRNGVPVFVVSGFTLFLFLPLAVRIVQNYQFTIWDFDFSASAFMFVVFLVMLLFGWCSYLCIRLVIRIRKCDRAIAAPAKSSG